MIDFIKNKNTIGKVLAELMRHLAETDHLEVRLESKFSTTSQLRVLDLRLSENPSSSTSRSHTASRPLSAMQLTDTRLILFARSSASEVANIEFTKAVFPHPGEPEIYKTGFVTSETERSLMKSVTKFRINCRSRMRPANSVELSQVARRSARVRICRGNEVHGVRGGVCNPKDGTDSVGLSGDARFDVDACRRTSLIVKVRENIESNRRCIRILDRVGVINSVLDRLRAREDSSRQSIRNGGMFSLFPLRSTGAIDVRGRLAHGLQSTVDASSSSSRRSWEMDLLLAGDGVGSTCDRWERLPRTEALVERRWMAEEDI